ncbi:TonB-dependent receptor [Woodsholea maritima]|uniref:TonB-dependent receptor n=1 Tax=Woodsholea maritima TaxID=240237 RepID=UPI0014616F15|nr:TonB-dependent receptor [Woodsholea maritima]
MLTPPLAAGQTTSPRLEFVIPAQPLVEALQVFSAQTDRPIAIAPGLAQGRMSRTLEGNFTPLDALTRLVNDANIELIETEAGFVVRPRRVAPVTTPRPMTENLPIAASMPTYDERIVVMGARLLNQSSIAAKYQADGLMDVMSFDQIGLLPDLTAVQVAQRIVGVSSVGASGIANDRSGDTAESLVIRGVDSSYNLVTLDGVPLAIASEALTGGGSRASTIEFIPPSNLIRFEVIKAMTPDKIGQALSGQLNLVTRSAFDSVPGFTLRAGLGHNSTAGRYKIDDGPDDRFDLVYTRTFGRHQSWGLVGALSHQRHFSTNYEWKPAEIGHAIRFYTDEGEETFDPATSNGMPAAHRNQIFIFDNDRERFSASAKLEYRPNDHTEATLYGGVFSELETEYRFEHLFVGEDGLTPPLNQTPTTGLWPYVLHQTGSVYQPQKRETLILTGQLHHDFNQTWHLRSVASYSQARADLTRVMSAFKEVSTDLAFTYDITPYHTQLRFEHPELLADPSYISENYIRDRDFESRQSITFFDNALSYQPAGFSGALSLKAGLALTLRNIRYDEDYVEGRTGTGLSAASFLFQRVRGFHPSEQLFYLTDPSPHLAEWNRVGRPKTIDRSSNSLQDDFTLTEHIYAPYLLARWEKGPFTLTGGARYEDVTVKVDNFIRDATIEDVTEDAEQFTPHHVRSHYETLLPSLAGRMDVTDQLTLRLGYSRTLGRPAYNTYATREALSPPVNGAQNYRLVRGNPNIRPQVSDNIDASIEYYFDEGHSYIAAAPFYKHISDLIFINRRTLSNYALKDQTVTVNLSQPVNLTSAALYGLELSFAKDLDFTLPEAWRGWLISGNAVLIGSEFTLPGQGMDPQNRQYNAFLNQPEMSINLMLGYDRAPFGFTLGYHWVSQFPTAIDSEYAYRDVIAQPRTQIDLQARWQITQRLTSSFEVQNLTQASRITERPFGLLARETEVGRTVWLGLIWRN